MSTEFSVPQNDEATAAHREGFAKVAALVPYLKAEIGPVDCVTAGASAIEDIEKVGTWFSCRDFIDNPEWLALVIRSSGLAIGTDDPVVAASIFVQGYAYRLLALTVACATAGSVIPDADPAGMAVGLARGRVAKVAYMAPAILECESGISVTDALRASGTADDVLRLIHDRVVAGHLRPLVASVRREIRVGERLLWGNIAASASTAFRTMEGCLGDWIVPLGERFFELAAPDLRGLGSFLAIEANGRQGWFWERTNCCLFDRLPGRIRCADCSRTVRDERRAAYTASLGTEQ